MTTDDLLDPLIGPGFKGFPLDRPALRRSAIGSAGWHALAGDLSFPIALLKRDAVAHNLQWMQQHARGWGIDLAPHGKTTMSPQLFTRQLEAGAWGITFATVTQLAVGIAAGVTRALIANQVLADGDLAAIQAMLASQAGLRVAFLVLITRHRGEPHRRLAFLGRGCDPLAGDDPGDVRPVAVFVH